MKKLKTFLIIGILIFMPSLSKGQVPIDTLVLTPIDMTWKYVDPSPMSPDTHRVPPSLPRISLDYTTNTIFFENPCYECTLEIVVPGTDSVAYTCSIPDGDNVVTLPEWLSGQYELHIHRGNFCFWGVIEL